MINKQAEQVLEKIPKLDKVGQAVARTVHNAVLSGGKPVRKVVDLLHGTWLGHPLHPMLTDVVVGAWSFTSLFDLVSLFKRTKGAESVADKLLPLGNVAAVPTLLSGLADYSTIPRPATRTGFVHSVMNNTAFVLYLASARARKKGDRGLAIGFSVAGMLFMFVGAYLGGHLTYDHKVGVNHTEPVKEPEDWTPVMDATELRDQQPQRVQVADNPVLLYRQNGRVLAIGAVCPHAGGPLEEGNFFDGCVQCPWHDSVFNLEDGAIVHGPSTYAVPNYEARIQNGRVEVRLSSA
jgi:nitrite reductase/ring-hydroxylating ferredoxin subunit/uncharacterized membrane protein